MRGFDRPFRCSNSKGMVMTDNPERELSRQMAAAQSLRDTIGAVFSDDAELIRDTIECETGLHEAISSVMALIREDEIQLAGIAALLKSLESREARLCARVERCREAILQAMTIGEIKTMTLPDATITVRAVSPGVEIIDEAAIPAEFWKPRDPVLDKTRVRDALKGGIAVPGAAMGNGGITLSIRRS